MSTTKWAGGNLNSGLAWTAFFQAADLNGLASGSSVLSSATQIANDTGLDQFFDISFKFTIGSTAIAAGATLAFWLFQLGQDGSTLGDGSLTAGSQAAVTPGIPPKLITPLYASTRTTLIMTNQEPLVMPPGKWAGVIQNNSGAAFSGSGNTAYFRSYNVTIA